MSVRDAADGFRPLLFSIAYRMLGSVADAEDAVQEAFLRWHRALAAGTPIESPKAWLTTTITRLCLDQLGSARAKRETYVGPWLPEPLVAESAPDVAETVAARDTLTTAFLLVLETLSPKERAAFLLHDVFGYGFAEVAGMIGETEANCRQLARRARERVAAGRPRFAPSPHERQRLTERFLRAITEGDVPALAATLAEDVVVWADGGGKANAARKPVAGRDKVATLLVNIGRNAQPGMVLRPERINGESGLAAFVDGRLIGTVSFDFADGVISAVYVVVNPDKLPPLAADPAAPELRPPG